MVDTFRSDIAKQSFNNRFKILIIVLTAMFMAVLNTNIVNVALPTITSFYNVPVGLSQWVITGYQVTATVTPLIFAKLSDYTGKSRLFIIGFSVFTVSSLACGLSTSLTELIIFRIVQALGGSMVLSINLAILMQIFPSYERGRVMGYFTAIIGFGMLMGPTIGGFIIDTMGWAYIFFVNLPIGIALLIPAFKYLKIEEYENKARYEDYLGAILFIISITTFFMVLNEISNAPLNLSSVAFYSAVCALTFLAFILREIRIQKPFLDISIFKIWSFTLPNISLLLYFTSTFILVLIQPFYFEGVMNFSPAKVGLVASVMPLAMMISSPVSGRIYDSLKLKKNVWIVGNYAMIGVAVMGIAYIVCGYAFTKANFILLLTTFVVAGLCRSIFQGPNNLDIMGALPPERSALASSITVTTQSFGLALGTAMGTLLLSVFLFATGYSGNVAQAGAGILEGICGNIMYISGILCFVGAVLSYKKIK
ncbi:DHA2 family efflux MFS transporter permease subunit [Methanobacterium paludis]|uniref:Drug resistance transporter, EmrB/QacA subfamily n=1 Tax=Methanobacterium paludis (strain DSM 25820 / JCM 18151 / SWAN1) TaxID=868131 RepID=F6D210_METPW|nr:DHA2 family efflux MFS transporter permease subunit [Methanobacterium paludis]AEG17299.1 drug resistance transporter, EmrB/QacA subfamily [Methanobacterium paludis]